MKLLSRTIRSFLFYSFAILLVTIPLFYFVVRDVLQHSVDRSLRMQMRDIRSNVSSIRSAEELQIWSKMDKDIRLQPTDQAYPDQLYTIYRRNRKHHDDEPFREISGTIDVNGNKYQLIISNSLVENDDLLGSILLVQSILLILLMAGMLWINQRISKKIWKPFYASLDAMKNYELGNHRTIETEPGPTDEFNELNRAIRHMTERSHATYLEQKEFTENAAHEMQTPLAIFRGKLELLMQTQPLSEEQARLIGSLENANLRLGKLNKSLLLLSKIENNQFPETEKVNLMEVLGRLIEQQQGAADLQGIQLPGPISSEKEVLANKELIEVLLNNLLSNAIRHNIRDGEVRIHLNGQSLKISNTGHLQALSTEKIFNRFYKSGTNSGSVGLGLAIAREISELYGFRIGYAYEEPWHSFTVNF